LDRNRDGGISIDELIAYMFPKQDVMGGTAGSSGYEVVLEAFRRYDANRNGTLDAGEFTNLMCALHPGQWDVGKTNQVFRLVDKDNNGSIESDELVAWIFGVPKDRAKAARRGRRDDADPRAVGLVVIEISFGGSGAETNVDQIAARWKKKFGDKLTVHKNVVRSTGIQKVTAREGSVVFWDAPAMIMFRENPFENMTSLRAWCDDMERRHIPRLLSGT
jgi:Ca2+-binding EF-hand superfamily protein